MHSLTLMIPDHGQTLATAGDGACFRVDIVHTI